MGLRLKYLDIQNFQGWKRGRIPFSDLTLLVGLSSAGKTSAIRALQFLLYGEWDATYPNDPEAATAVAIEFENGTRVLRIRKGNQNQAAIIRDGETTKYKSFGAIIPGLSSLLNVDPIDVGTKEIHLNFSLQDDPTFMLSESRPTKAQWIGRLYGAHIINQMFREMAKDKKHAQAIQKEAENQLQGLQNEFKVYSSIPEQEALLEQARALTERYKGFAQCLEEKTRVDVLKAAYGRDVWALKVDTKEIKENLSRLSSLLMLRDEALAFAKERAEVKQGAKLLKVDTGELKKKVELFSTLKDIHGDLVSLGTNSAELHIDIGRNEAKLVELRSKLDSDMLTGDKCPVCGGPVGKEREHVLSNIARLIGSK